MKKTVQFRFTYTLTKQAVRDLKIVVDKLSLEVSGTGYFYPNNSVLDIHDRFSADIDYVVYHGKDVKELLDFTGSLEEIEEAAVKYVAKIFTEKIAA